MGFPDVPPFSFPDVPAFHDLLAIFTFIISNTGVAVVLFCILLLSSHMGGSQKKAATSQTDDVTNMVVSVLLGLGILIGAASALGSPIGGLPSIGAPINWDNMPTVHLDVPSAAPSPSPHAP